MEPLLILAAPLVALVALLILAPNLCRRKSTRRGITVLCALTALCLAAAAGYVPLEALLIAGGLGAVTANQVIKKQTTQRGTGPIYESTTIYEGTFCFVNSTGYVTGDTDSGASMFAGIAVENYDNSSGSSGDLDAEWFAEGIFELTGSGFTQADVGKEVFASDNYTITLTDSSSAVPIGVVQEYVSATAIRVKITGLPNVPGITSNVMAFTGSTGANEIRVPDNLADGLSVEGTHGDFLVFVTTNGSEEMVISDQARLPDSIPLYFGTGSDISLQWDGSNLVLATASADTGALEVGADDAGVDVVFYGDTASEHTTWDQSADKLIMTAAVQITGQGSTVVPLIPIAAQKKIQLTTDGGGDATLTPTSLDGGTTITFADVGDYAILCWDGSNWVVLELGNDADGTTAPVLA